MKVNRRTVDLSTYPDLVVIYLGMRVRTLMGLKTLLGFGPKIAKSVADQPDGMLLHENFLWSLFPPHAGIRQYWRDFESLERWGAIGAAPGLVEELSAGLWWHWLLARDLFHAGRHRGNL